MKEGNKYGGSYINCIMYSPFDLSISKENQSLRAVIENKIQQIEKQTELYLKKQRFRKCQF